MIAIKLGEAYVEITADQTKLTAGLNKAQKSVGNSMKAIGKSMTIAGGVIVAGFAMAIKTGAKFEQSMANTASVAGATGEELKALSDFAREMGEQSVFSASQAADAMYFLASAGMNVDEIMGALEGTLALAAATQSDLAYTSAAVAAALSQFALDADEATRIANVYAAAISGSQATMEKLTTSMSYVGPMAHSMGMEIEDTTGILMALYDAGLDGSKAGTALRMAFVKLLKPTEAGTTALEDLGVSIVDSEGKMRPFVDIMEDLEKAGMSTIDAINIFGVRAGPAMMALISQGTDAIRENTEAVTDTEKAYEMAAMQIDTFEGAMKLLRSAFEELQLTLVQDLLPSLKDLIGDLTEGVKKVTAWMKKNPELVESFAKWGLAIGAVMLVLGPLLMVLPGLATAIGLLTGPIALVVAAAVALYFAFKDWEKFKEIVTKVKDAVIGKVKEWASALNEWWEDIVANTDNQWILFADKIKDAIVKTFDEAIKKISEWITTIRDYWENINADADSWWNKTKEVVTKAIEGIINFATITIPKLVVDIGTWWTDILNNTDTTWEAIKTAVLDIGQRIIDELGIIIPNLVSKISGWWQDIIDDTDIKWLLVIDKVIGAIGNLITWFAITIGGWITTIAGYWSDIDSDAESWWSKIKDIIINAAKGFIDFLWEGLPQLILDIIAWWDEIRLNTETIWEAIYVAVIDAIDRLLQKIGIDIPGLVKNLSDWWENIKTDASTKWEEICTTITEWVTVIIDWFTEEIPLFITSLFDWWVEIWEDANLKWEEIKVTILYWVSEVIRIITEKIEEIILELIKWWETIRTDAETFWGNIKTAISTKVDEIYTTITTVLEPVVKWLSDLWGSIETNVSTAWGTIEGIITGAISLIESAISAMITVIENAWATAKSIYNKIKDLMDAAQQIADEGITIGPPTAPGWEPGGVAPAEPTPELPSPWYHQRGIPYVPKKGFYGLDIGERVLTARERVTYNQQKTYSNPINIQPGAIQIITPKFSSADAKDMFRLIEKEARMRGLAFGRV